MLERSDDLQAFPKFLILGLNRDNPGFGDDAVLADCETKELEFFEGAFQRGTRHLTDQAYSKTCDEYRENGWASDDSGEDDTDPTEDDLYEDQDGWNTDAAESGSTVIVPEKARTMVPGTEVRISCRMEGDDPEPERTWISDSYRIDGITASCGLAFHTNATMDGIMLDEDFFRFPLICWNTGERPIKVEGERIPAGKSLILLPRDPKRVERRLRHRDVMSLPVWDSEARIQENERRLLALGCPVEDAQVLAGYFWRSLFRSVEDYRPADHAAWMDEVRREGRG